MVRQNEKLNPERKRARVSKEFKREAVRLLELGQRPATQLALELGVNRNQLYKWQGQLKAKGDGAFRSPGALPLDARTEIERLKPELKKVTEERDISKKGRGVLREGPAVKYAFIERCRSRFTVAALCRALRVSSRVGRRSRS